MKVDKHILYIPPTYFAHESISRAIKCASLDIENVSRDIQSPLPDFKRALRGTYFISRVTQNVFRNFERIILEFDTPLRATYFTTRATQSASLDVDVHFLSSHRTLRDI